MTKEAAKSVARTAGGNQVVESNMADPDIKILSTEDYERMAARTTPPFTTDTDMLVCAALGLAGEAGEVVDHIKKVVYHGHELDRVKLLHEAGDIIWYLALLLRFLGSNFLECMWMNTVKLAKRYPDGFSSERSINREDKVK